MNTFNSMNSTQTPSPNTISFVTRNYSTNHTIDVCGNDVTQYNQSYSSTARSINTETDKTYLLLNSAFNNPFTIYTKHASRIYTDNVLGRGYAIVSVPSTYSLSGTQITISFYTLHSTVNVPFLISNVVTSDINNADLSGVFTSNNQSITYTLTTTRTFVMTAGTSSVSVPYVGI